MADPVMEGKGFLFSHSDTNVFAYILGADWEGIERAMHDRSHTATPVFSGSVSIRNMEPSDWVSIGRFRFRLFWGQASPAPLFSDPELCTLQGPTPRGKSVGCKITDRMVVAAMGVAIQIDQDMTSDVTVELCGTNYSFTASA